MGDEPRGSTGRDEPRGSGWGTKLGIHMKYLVIESSPFNGIQIRHEIPLTNENIYAKPYIIRKTKELIIDEITRKLMPPLPPQKAIKKYRVLKEIVRRNIQFNVFVYEK